MTHHTISMRSRIVLYILLFSFSLLLLIITAVHLLMTNHFRHETKTKLHVISYAVENSGIPYDTIEGQLFLNRLSHEANCKISLFDENGIYLYDSPYTYLPANPIGSAPADPVKNTKTATEGCSDP